MAVEAVRVRGLRELNKAFKFMDKEVAKEMRKEFRNVAEPIRVTAEQLLIQRISNIRPQKPRSWARMRIGMTQTLVYVAPKQRGRFTQRNPERYRRGTPFGTRLMEEGMAPALAQHAHEVEHRVGVMLDRVADRAGF